MQDRKAPERRLRRPGAVAVGGLALLLSAGLWLGTLAAELASRDRVLRVGSPSRLDPTRSESDRLLEAEAGSGKAERIDASKLLPISAPGWIVQGPQEVPGSGGAAIEAYFNPTEEDQKLVTPLVVYVQVRREADEVAARVALDAWVRSRYGVEPSRESLVKHSVLTAGAQGGRSYFVGWVSGPYVYGVDAAFTRFVPGGARKIGGSAAKAVAEEILRMPGSGAKQ